MKTNKFTHLRLNINGTKFSETISITRRALPFQSLKAQTSISSFGQIPRDLRLNLESRVVDADPMSPSTFSSKGLLPKVDLDAVNNHYSSIPDTAVFAKRESVLFHRIYPIIPRDHSCHKMLQDDLNEILEEAGIPRDKIKISIFQSPMPDLSIHFYSNEIRIAWGFLDAVNWERDQVIAGLAHEIGHYVLGHYKHQDETERYDPLARKISSYENEYQADKAGIYLINILGIDPNKFISMLENLEASTQKILTVFDENENADPPIDREDYNVWILSSHPHIQKRKLLLRDYIRKLPPCEQKTRKETKLQYEFLDGEEFLAAAPNHDFPSYYENYDPRIVLDCVWDKADPSDFNLANLSRSKLLLQMPALNGRLHEFFENPDDESLLFMRGENTKNQYNEENLLIRNSDLSLADRDRLNDLFIITGRFLNESTFSARTYAESQASIQHEESDIESIKKIQDTEEEEPWWESSKEWWEAMEKTWDESRLRDEMATYSKETLSALLRDCGYNSNNNANVISFLIKVLIYKTKKSITIDDIKTILSALKEFKKRFNDNPIPSADHKLLKDAVFSLYERSSERNKKQIAQLCEQFGFATLEESLAWWKGACNKIASGGNDYSKLISEINLLSNEEISLLIKDLSFEKAILYKDHTDYSGESLEKLILQTDIGTEVMRQDKINELLSGMPQHEAIEIITSLMFKKYLSQGRLKELLPLLREYRDLHGVYLPHGGGTLLLHFRGLYEKASPDEKMAIEALYREYEREITLNGKNTHVFMAEKIIPEIFEKMEAGRTASDGPQEKTLEGEIKELADDKNITPDVARTFLLKIPNNYRPQNISHVAESYAINLNKEIDAEGTPDELLMAHPYYVASGMTGEDFDEKYFGDREKYNKVGYSRFEANVYEFTQIYTFWEKAGYKEEFKALPPGANKLKFLAATFPAMCAIRDQLIVNSLKLPKLEFVDDVIKVGDEIKKISDIETLMLLRDHLSNPHLTLAVSKRLWAIYSKNPEEFLRNVPMHAKENAELEINSIDSADETNRLLPILLCYPHPSYLRDELLNPIIDDAPSKEKTFGVANLLFDVPFTTFKPRQTRYVIATESLANAIENISSIDKQEMMMYFLGCRFFYTGIEEFFPHMRRGDELTLRQDAIYDGKEEFGNKYGLSWAAKEPKKNIDEFGEEEYDEEYDEEYENYNTSENHQRGIDPRYLVDMPDVVFHTSNATGIPAKHYLEQRGAQMTKREQRDFLTIFLLGRNGILNDENKGKFLKAVSREFVENGNWAQRVSKKQKDAMIDFLAFAFERCHEVKIVDMFLNVWNLQKTQDTLPKMVAQILQDYGGVMIKAGQYLSTQSSLPQDWTNAFRQLADQNKQADKLMAYEYEEALYAGRSPLSRIGAKLGEGSMAAVYDGSLNTGENVAVKIFHPQIGKELDMDCRFLDDIVGYVNEHQDAFQVVLPRNLSEITKGQVEKELSFESIMGNHNDMRRVINLSSKSKVTFSMPKLYDGESKNGIYMTHKVEGEAVDKIEGEKGKEIRSEVAFELLRQILKEGLYQADPNPGNFKAVGWDEQGKKPIVYWLDTDHVGRLTPDERNNLKKLAVELSTRRSKDVISQVLYSFIDNGKEKDKKALDIWVSEQTNNMQGNQGFDNVENLLSSFLSFLDARKLMLKGNYVTLLRTLGLMKPLLKDIDPKEFLKRMPGMFF